MITFYHGDADGITAAHVVNKHSRAGEGEYSEFIKINYGDKFPFEKIKKNETIFIVDYSISPEEMEQLLLITENVIWIDHHITAINKYKDFPRHIRGLRYNGISGCELTYMYLNDMTDNGLGEEKEFNPEWVKDVPMYIRYVGDRDVWKFEFGQDTKYFCTGLQTLKLEPQASFFDYLSSIDVDASHATEEIMEKGRILEDYKRLKNQSYLKHFGYECEILGFEHLKAFACNIGHQSSELYDSLEEKYDVFVNYAFNGKTYNVSVYQGNKDTDVSQIALFYGGGGHRGAAGFEVDNLPISLKKEA